MIENTPLDYFDSHDRMFGLGKVVNKTSDQIKDRRKTKADIKKAEIEAKREEAQLQAKTDEAIAKSMQDPADSGNKMYWIIGGVALLLILISGGIYLSKKGK